MLELVFPNFGGFEDHWEGLDERAVVVDYFYPNKRFEDLGEVESEPIFEFSDSHSQLLNIGLTPRILSQTSLHCPHVIDLELPSIDLIHTVKTAIELASQLDIVPCREHELL